MENNNYIEGWVATDVNGTHLFVNKPYRAKFGTHLSWVGYQIKDADSLALRAKSELNIKDNDEPIKVKININTQIVDHRKTSALVETNKFDYTPIDLGLPSGTLWCNRNVGASKPSDFGLYFQWGNVRGFTKGQIGGDKAFSWPDYKFSIDGSSSNFSKYTTDGESLELADDAANANMGGSWHMPSPTQLKELTANTTSTWTTQDGVNGRLFTSKKNGKSIFIPAAGYASGDSLHNEGSEADVWSSMLSTYYVNDGQYLFFGSGIVFLNDRNRYCGFSVRGVIG